MIPGDGSNLSLSLESLRELQSKLMLIAGEADKGQSDVNQFIDVLTSVEKLAEICVKLQSSGCMLFSGWEATIVCQGNHESSMDYLSIQIVFASGAPPLTGRGCHTDLDKITGILEESLKKWEEHVAEERMKHYYLNEFSIDQIIYLCHELSILEDSEEVSDQVYTLLSFVRENFTEDELKQSLEQAKRDATFGFDSPMEEPDDEMSSVDDEVGDEEGEEQDNNVREARRSFAAVRTLMAEDNIPEDQAKAAVQANGHHDMAECRIWLLENQFEDDLIEELSSVFDENYDQYFSRKKADILHSAFKENRNNTLNDVISRLQQKIAQHDDTGGTLLDSVATICEGYLNETIAMNLQDHLSIGLLGQTLMNLSVKNDTQRKMLQGLRRGKPNILVCGEDEMLPTVLSLYMHNRVQPLPSRSEVLICSDETTKDEVERFIRRALCLCPNTGQLLYTLASGDKLNYTNSVAVVDIFNKCCKGIRINTKFQLIILLSKQQHYLATYFYKYVVDGKWACKTEEISKYLEEQLKVEELANSAASAVQGHSMVKVVKSTRSGVGKSLYIQRVRESLAARIDFETRNVTMRLMENKIDLDYIIRKLCPNERIQNKERIMAHVDLTPAVASGIEAFVFNLFVLGSIQGSDGKVWKNHTNHLYLVEMTDFGTTGEKRFSSRHILNLLPCVRCYPPLDVLKSGEHNLTGEWVGMDRIEFQSEIFQRPYQYLLRYEKGINLDEFSYSQVEGEEDQCIAVLLRHCCINNPSWAQLRHFCSFLNFQLRNCENSVFCNSPDIKEVLVGLKAFAVRFMIKMAQDFATPSLTISDTSTKDAEDSKEFRAHQLRRKWEESFHPYVFFNEDGQTMTFVNVKIDRQGNLLGKNDQIIEKIILPELTTALHQQRIELRKNFDDYSRREKLCSLCQVLGIEDPFDPDPTYELTTDNVLKILAIYMRFQCGIPVIIMGETGCGKTRLVEFMSKLKAGKVPAPTEEEPDGNDKDEKELQNMTTLKIHGGITVYDIHRSVEAAKVMEHQLRCQHQMHNNFAVLFCDEANTTEAIYAIKEVMCDRSIDGEFFHDSNLKIVAACNPYKKLSKAAIAKLEDSGLGYRIRTSKTAHLFGNIPVRSLVYRVVALPPSMQPFVWDFGQLNDEAERIYIQQMTRKLAQKLGLNEAQNTLINNVLSRCQQYMRQQTDECRYVSLRDVERCMITFEWFYKKRGIILPMISEEIRKKNSKLAEPKIGEVVRILIQTVAVCYHASLDEREPFRRELSRCLNLPGVDEERINTEIIFCQSVFLRNVRVGQNIARNQALRENVFMMVVCTDMRIPLFLVGKPGSSKSLAKTIVTNNMQGQTSHANLYKNLKQIHILSYQCSALTDADGIKKVFNQCVQLQKKQNLETYTAVVVLDEIGLAEDSPNMPLKILHPLLERRSTDLMSVSHEDSERVGFIGISNWALDPAKMNRGIFLTRNRPEEKDLRKTGKEIFQGRNALWNNNEDLLEKLTETYVKMYNSQKVEYFGLRDYYSLMKMICNRCPNTDEDIELRDVIYAISRNFGGGDPVVIEKFVGKARSSLQDSADFTDATIPIQRMIQDNLSETESRFLLLLANQFSIVSLLESCIENFAEGYQVVFGSSFPGDHSYTEICRNINKIKVCMETGRTVILLNMAKIHESLYDALNQHFATMGGKNFVDLGLGGHRVKCRITTDFRLIVIEKSEVVRREYPIPLINRLEKHHFKSERLLDDQKKIQSHELREWAFNFSSSQSCFTCQHAFIGYHDDTPGSIIFTSANDEMDQHKRILLQTCPMDAIFRLRDSRFGEREKDNLQAIYFNEQQHDGLVDVLKEITKQENHFSVLEVTSFSGVLWDKDVEELERLLDLKKKSITLLPLEQFQTQQEYCNRLDKFFQKCEKQQTSKFPIALLVQCAQAQLHSTLIACARYSLMNKIRDFRGNLNADEETNITIALLLSTEREGLNEKSAGSLNLQHTSETLILHVDELHPTDEHISPASNFFDKSLQEIFLAGKQELENEAEQTGSLVNIKALLLDSVTECMSKIKYSGNSERNLERIDLLMNLYSMNDDIGKHFREIALSKVIEAFAVIGDRYGEGMDWIIERANDGESLQDAGTFRKALWLCLKCHLSRFLAFIISKIDRNSNLDIVSKDKPDPWEIEMWFGMFQLFDIPWKDMLDVSHYVVADSRKIMESCGIPFSFVIIDYLESQWKVLQSQNRDSQDPTYCRIFREFKMRGVVSKALARKKAAFMKKFVSDIVKYLYIPGTNEVVESLLVAETILDFAMKDFQQARKQDDFEDGDEIVVMYMTFKKFSHKLEILTEVLQRCPEILLENQKKWVTIQSKQNDFVLHVLAFKDALGLLKQMAENIQDPRICVDWIDLAREVKKLYGFVTNDVKDKETLKEINKDWNPLRLLDLLLLQLLPPAHVDNVLFKRFVKTIAPQAKLFWRGTARADPRSQNFMRIVLNVLRKCSSDIELQLLVNWKDPKCKVCGKTVKKPMFLPCRHFGCENCILHHLVPDRNGKVKCPICNVEIPDDFTPTLKVLDGGRQKITEQTKFNCTSFFLEYLQQFCFSSGDEDIFSARMEPQMKQIIKYLIVEDRDDRPELDPSGLDMNINFKSCVLQLLLDFNHNLVETEINRFLQDTEEESQQSLLTVIIKTLLRKVSVNSGRLNYDFGKMTRFWEATLRKSWRTLTGNEAELNLKTIQEIVEVRNALCHFTDVIEIIVSEKKQDENNQKQIAQFAGLAIRFITESPNAIKEFVLKCGNKKYGLQWLKELSNHDEFKAIIPPYLKQAVKDRSADFWVLLGREYVETKSRIYQNDPTDYETEAAAIFDQHQGENPLPHALAVMSWAKGKDLEVQQRLIGVLQHKCGDFVNFLNLLSHGDQTLLGVIERNATREQQANTLFQIVVMVLVTLTTSQNDMLQGFNQIIQNVQTVQGLYLPTMQEHRFFSTPAEFRNENQQTNSMYTCPRGHLYSIGDCTRPVVEAFCPECKSRIGGKQYASAPGNQKVIMNTQSQSGYKKNTEDRNFSTGAERMTLQGHAAVQFILHSSLLAGSLNNPRAVADFVGFRNRRDIQTFLVQQLQQNIVDLAKGLAKNIDDAAYIMMRVLLRIQQMGQTQHAHNWSSMDHRKAWEQAFRQEYLLPILQNIEYELAVTRVAIEDSEELRSAPLTTMLQDVPHIDRHEEEEFVWQMPSLWSIIEHKDANHLMQKLENSADDSGGEVLKIIVKSRNLEYLKHLESILTLQQKLAERYQYKLDLRDADAMTLRNHIEREEVTDEELVKKYIVAWNELYPTLKGVAPDFLGEHFEPLTMDSPLSMALPSIRGRGQCAKLIAEYLIETQNNFLNECISVIKPRQILKEVEVQQMTSSDFLCIDKEKDFIGMIDMHTSYRIDTDGGKGREHFTDYNFEALEKQAREKYVLCKKLIKKNTLLCMKYLQDVGIGDDWRKVESTIPQEPLTAKLCQDIDGAVEKSHSADVCERVRTLTSAIRFLAMVNKEPNKLLHEFLQNDLKLPAARTSIIPRSAQILHVLSIYQRLTWHKAIIFIKRDLDPYKEALCATTQEDIPSDILNKTKEAFARTDIPKLQQKMNKMLITGTGIDDPNWSLVEDVFPFLDDDDESWYGKLPKKLCNKHISHLFKESVKYKSDKD